MGRKPFISKAAATKYDLVYRTDQDPNKAPERAWVESDRHVGIGKPDAARLAQNVREEALQDRRYPAGHPLEWLNEESSAASLSEACRQEIIRLGFPDDGYDYLQHMRQGHNMSALSVSHSGSEFIEAGRETQQGGSSFFVPAPAFEAPPEDYKAIDAGRLMIHQATTDEDEALLLAGGATAFAKELQTLRGRNQREVEDLEMYMKQFESSEQIEGDLLEDFVLSATEAATGDVTSKSEADQGQEIWKVSPSAQEIFDSDSDDENSSADTDEGLPAPSENRSFASTYWRPERHDRKGDLSVIDERFEQLALEYDSDEIGDLDQYDGHPSLKGSASADRYAKVLDKFLAVHNTQDHAHDSGHAYNSAAETAVAAIGTGEQPGPCAASKQLSSSAATETEQASASAALAKAKEHLRRLEEEDDAAMGREEERAAEAAAEAAFGERPKETWDCESILTSCSTAYNHPKRLDDRPQRRRHQQDQQEGALAKRASQDMHEAEEENREDRDNDYSHRQRPLAAGSARKADESLEEKKRRKETVKEAKRQARANKKELKNMFKDASQRQQRQSVPKTSILSLA